jgi:Heterokaryon incompatibility protein (HET)
MMENYKYRILGDGEIRVLKPKSRSELAFELVHVSPDKNPRYSALSYTWGAALFPCYISIANRILLITENLRDALQALIALSKAKDHPICIYQDRYRSKCCRNLRFEPQFCEGVGFAHLYCGGVDPTPIMVC